MDCQWHILIDGGQAPLSLIYNRRRDSWTEGPQLPILAQSGQPLPDEARQSIASALDDIVRNGRYGPRVRSLGVVLHVADEFAVADLNVEFGVDEDFEHVRRSLDESPQNAIGDTTQDLTSHTWRLIPQWGLRDGERRSIAVQLTRRHQDFLLAVKEHGLQTNTPIIPHALSAPLVALRFLPLYITQTSGSGEIALLQYTNFTTLVVLDQAGELIQIRSLLHRRGQSHPVGAADILLNTAAAMNLTDPIVHVIPMGSANTIGLKEDLARDLIGKKDLNVRFVEPAAHHPDAVPTGRIEMMVGNPAALVPTLETSPLARTQTFSELASGWATQNFDDSSEKERAIYPNRQELVSIGLLGKAKFVFMLVALALGGYAGFEAALLSQSDAWAMREVDIAAQRIRLDHLVSEDKRIAYWESMLEPRSEGWLVMELALRLLPEGATTLITSYDYSVAGEAPRNGASQNIGYRRSWRLEGHIRRASLAELTNLSSPSYVKAKFSEIAKDFSSSSFVADSPTRNLSVTMQQQQGSYPPNGILSPNEARLYQTKFELTITQLISDRDELAVTLTPPVAPPEPGQSNGPIL